MAHIIKQDAQQSGTTSGDVTRPLSFQLPDWSQRADEFLARVRQEGAEILEKARHEADAIRKTAEQQGYSAGQQRAAQAAREVAERQMQTLMPALEKLVAQLEQARGSWLARWEKQLIELAVAIGGQLAQVEVERNPQITCEWIREALELVNGPGCLIVRLNPHDHAALQPHLDLLKSRLHPAAELVVQADSQVEPGGALVQTEFGELDQQLSARMARLREELSA